MHLVSLDRVSAVVDGRVLFADASFGLTSRDRVAILGPNGVGKTTLLRIIAGRRPPDEGRVVHRSGLRIGWSGQTPELPAATALDAVAEGDPLAARHEVEALLSRLGVHPAQPTDRASGGERRRIALARALLAPSDLLVLDEPTNHLDVDAVDWLEQQLARRAGGLVLVTHDRYVLERLTDRLIDLAPPAPGRPADVLWHEGSYSSLLEARRERRAARERATDRAAKLLDKEIAWLRRGPRARTSKPRFRVEQVERLREAAQGDGADRPLELGTGRRRLGGRVFELEGVLVTRGGRDVLDRVDLTIGPGERVGIVGANGAGKTTLLELLAGRRSPDEGRLEIGRTVQSGLYEQEAVVPGHAATVLDTVLDVAEHVPLANGELLPAHRLAERFGFDARLQRTPVRLLSGGERRRVALLHLLVAAPNVVLLDEPTNDLDLDTLMALEDHLDGFAGTLVVASHDRYVLDRLTDRVVAVVDGQLQEHLDWSGYRRAQLGAGAPPRRSGRPHDASADLNRRRQEQRRRARSLEQRLERLTRRRQELHARMAAAADRPDELLDLQGQLGRLEGELGEVEDAWLAAATADDA